MSITTKVTRELTGNYGTLKGREFKEFAAIVPDDADLKVHEYKPYPGEFGGTTWKIEATWNEES